MLEVGVCNWRYILRIILISTGVFLFFSLINSLTLMGFSKFYYNTSYDCIYENVTLCFNPENRLIAQWAIGLSFVIVMVALALFILYLTVQYIRKRRNTYEIVTIPNPYDELEFKVGSRSISDTDTDSDSEQEKGKDKTD